MWGRDSEWTPEDIPKTYQAFKADRKQKRDRIKIAGLEMSKKIKQQLNDRIRR